MSNLVSLLAKRAIHTDFNRTDFQLQTDICVNSQFTQIYVCNNLEWGHIKNCLNNNYRSLCDLALNTDLCVHKTLTYYNMLLNDL